MISPFYWERVETGAKSVTVGRWFLWNKGLNDVDYNEDLTLLYTFPACAEVFYWISEKVANV